MIINFSSSFQFLICPFILSFETATRKNGKDFTKWAVRRKRLGKNVKKLEVLR